MVDGITVCVAQQEECSLIRSSPHANTVLGNVAAVEFVIVVKLFEECRVNYEHVVRRTGEVELGGVTAL